MDIYREEILDHYKNPRNQGKLKVFDMEQKEANASCGDEVEVFIKLKNIKNEGVVDKIGFEAGGCALSVAAGSMLFEQVVKKRLTLKEAGEISFKDLEKLVGVKVGWGRRRCLELPLQALKKIAQKAAKKGGSEV